MIRHLVIFGVYALLVACDSRVSSSVSYPSPNGKLAIAVVEELQGANDPAPWWTHVSILEAEGDSHQVAGNLLKLEGRGSVSAQWDGNAAVTVLVDDALFDSQVSSRALNKRGVRITIRRVSDQSKSNSEADAPQPATARGSKPEGDIKADSESEGRSQ